MPHGNEERDEQVLSKSFKEMDAIARGVEAKLDLLTGHSEIVIQRTIDIARQLGIPKKEIQRWAGVKTTRDSERNRVIEPLLNQPKLPRI